MNKTEQTLQFLKEMLEKSKVPPDQPWQSKAKQLSKSEMEKNVHMEAFMNILQ